MEKYLDVTISGIFGLVGVVLGFFLQIVSNWLSERKHIREEFYEIKNAIYSIAVANNLFSELLKLKHFFIRHPKFLKNKENNYFFPYMAYGASCRRSLYWCWILEQRK